MTHILQARCAAFVVTLWLLPGITYAQEATLSGAVTDSTGGVLPGVTLTVVHEATGNAFTTVTDERGNFRLPVRVGIHRMTVELAGFTTVTRAIDLLVGQQAAVNLQMSPSGVQESVTVTAEAPLIDTSTSKLGGNVDPNQMQALPLNGRNWQDLAMLAPGMKANDVTDQPVSGTVASLAYQINLDGQQITNDYGTIGGGPRFSRDAIAEFEFLSSRFDATQGRSSGVQVNAITKSGTNTPSGSFSGYFRSDKFNAADFIQQRVIPYSDQQVSATYGGPIVRDRFHYFANYEFEREPQTYTYSSPYPSFNIDQSGTRTEHKGGLRLDFQLASPTRLTIRANKFDMRQPYDSSFTGGATFHPSRAQSTEKHQDELLVTLNHIFTNRSFNETSAGYASYFWANTPVVVWSGHPQGRVLAATDHGTPVIQFNGYRIGQGETLSPSRIGISHYSVRDNFTTSFSKGGQHVLKMGGEYIYIAHTLNSCRSCMGILDAQGGPIPANIEQLFPVWNDPLTWNLAALSPIVRSYTIGVGTFPFRQVRDVIGAWAQDDWTVNSRLTLNLGLRYDLSLNVFAQDVVLQPFLGPGRPQDNKNFGPRFGFAYTINPKTVLRGGVGKYFGDVTSGVSHFSRSASLIAMIQVLNDGRPDFAANPFNGQPLPSYQQAIASSRLALQSIAAPDLQMPWSYQASMGVQRQYGEVMSVEADYVLVATRSDLATRNINLSFNPATGVNYPFTDVTKLPYPGYGIVTQYRGDGKTTSHTLQTAFTKRMRNRWQASASYTLAGDWTYDPRPLNPGCQNPVLPTGACDVAFNVAPDLGEGAWHWAGTQRHRAAFNGLWQLGYGVQLSGLYFFGSGAHLTPTSGVDVRGTGSTTSRLLRDGTLIPWASFATKPLHRVDIRVQRSFPLGGRAKIDGIIEVFNLLNHANYGSWVTNQASRTYGQPSFNSNVAYSSRALQLGFRATF